MLGIEVVSNASILGQVATRQMIWVTQPPKDELLSLPVTANLRIFFATMVTFPASREEGEAFREHSDHHETVRITDRQCPSDRAFHHSAGAIDSFLAGGPVRGRFLLLLRRGNSLAGSDLIRMCSR